uniref:Zona pellucida sperm-binding protein 3 n=1 Tax=Acanthochromis polyacanthus TaxID=80966 RepID=A0A3Q1G965_9TELE
MKQNKHMVDMMLIVRIPLCLFCGALAAAAARDFYQDVHLADRRFTGLRPERPVVQEPAGTSAVQQEKQSFQEPLSWRFPEPPAEEEPHFPPNFELKPPAAADSVTAICGESSVRVEAKKDLLGIGKPVQAADVTLGGCASIWEDPEVLVFESELHSCGSQLMMSEDSFIYIFTLFYTPSPLGDSPIIRTVDFSISIQCHYQRKHDVSSGLLKPTWTPFSGTKVSDENLYFSLRLMTDDWQFPRPSAQFLLGDKMRFEASVKQFHHIPLRVTVDSCVASVAPNIDTVPRYAFLGNKGCLFDSQLTGSSSQFLPRSQDGKLQFEIEAFKFQQDNTAGFTPLATTADTAVDTTNKACSFSNGWREASGSHRACSCCDTNCGTSSKSDLTEAGSQLTGLCWLDAVLPPFEHTIQNACTL